MAEMLARTVMLLSDATLQLTRATVGGERLEAAPPAPLIQAGNGYGVLARVIEVDVRSGGPGEVQHVGVWYQQTGAVPGHATQLWYTVPADEPVPFKAGQIVLLTATVQR